MTQNIYDDPGFFSAYSGLERSIHGLDGAAEWPSLRALLPAMQGLHVLDLGCGFGWFCRWAREQGAASVLGIDVSERMLERAAQSTADPAITYRRGDMETLELPQAAFDLAYSSLAFHYVENLEGLLATTYRALVPGGHLVFSVEHPIFTAPTPQGWAEGADGRRRWPVDGYLDEGPRTTDWLAEGIIKQHRTLATYINLLIRTGFRPTRVDEWGPSEEQVRERPEWAVERERPPFLLFAARR